MFGNLESGVPQTKEQYLKNAQDNERVIRALYHNNEVIDPNILSDFSNNLLSDEVLRFKIMLESVIQEDTTLETILQGQDDERIAISDFIINTTVLEIEALFLTLPQDTQEGWLDGCDDDE